MKPVFSNLSYFLKTKSIFFYLPYKFVWGILRSLRSLKILIGKFLYYYLKFCQMMPQKVVSDCVNDKGLGFVVNM